MFRDAIPSLYEGRSTVWLSSNTRSSCRCIGKMTHVTSLPHPNARVRRSSDISRIVRFQEITCTRMIQRGHERRNARGDCANDTAMLKAILQPLNNADEARYRCRPDPVSPGNDDIYFDSVTVAIGIVNTCAMIPGGFSPRTFSQLSTSA